MTATWAHIDKSKKVLGWKPSMPLEKGIEKTVKWFIENTRKTELTKPPLAPWSIIIIDQTFHFGWITAVIFLGNF